MSFGKYAISVFPMPGVLLGAASAVDLFGSIGLTVRADLPESVQEALSRDWEAVYGDVDRAYARVVESVP